MAGNEEMVEKRVSIISIHLPIPVSYTHLVAAMPFVYIPVSFDRIEPLEALDMKIETIPMAEADFELSYLIKREALGPHVAKRWPWNDDTQRQIHREHWQQRRFLAIRVDDETVGTVSIQTHPDHVRLGEFYILPRCQNKGIGSHILAEAIAEADAARLPIRLEYLKWNPVGALYKRNGFQQIAENETHCFMERTPPGHASQPHR